MFVLRTQGGFCNRLRAIVSSVLWAEDLDRKLAIYWPVEIGHLPCSIEEVLEMSSIPRCYIIKNSYLSEAIEVQSTDDFISKINWRGNDGIFVQSYSAFHSETYSERGITVLKNLRFNKHLENQADARWNSLNGKSSWTGIHFRGTDHKNCLLASPVSSFLKYLAENPDENFYLASDETSVKKQFIQQFSRCFTFTFRQGRINPDEQTDGIVEWLLLQKCSKIVASKGSSYSHLAALRCGAKFIEI